MFKKLLSGVQDKYRKMQEEEERYQDLLQKSFTLPEFYPIPPVEKKNITISHKLLMELCPDLNENDAILVRNLIPIDEICLSCLYATECKTNLKFYFVATTKYLWLINAKGYLKYRYQGLTIEQVKDGLMSKVLWIGNMLFSVNGLNEVINEFIKLFEDTNRQEVINKQLQVFCETTPSIYYLNDIGSGISIGENNEIVFHTKTVHYKYFINDIKNYELLLDDMVVREKKNNRRARLTANKASCYQMTLRITANDQIFLIPILKKTAFMTLYSSTSKIFMENKAFADKLINLLDDLDEKMLNGEIKKPLKLEA